MGLVTSCTTSYSKLWNVVGPIRSFGFLISITSVRYVQEFSQFSRDYETLMTLYVVMLTIIEFPWNNSMLPDPIPEK